MNEVLENVLERAREVHTLCRVRGRRSLNLPFLTQLTFLPEMALRFICMFAKLFAQSAQSAMQKQRIIKDERFFFLNQNLKRHYTLK